MVREYAVFGLAATGKAARLLKASADGRQVFKILSILRF